MSRTLLTKKMLAAKVHVTPRSITSWHSQRFIRAYTAPGSNRLLFDLDEVLAAIEANPSMRPPSKLHGQVVPLSERVTVLDVPRRPVVVVRSQPATDAL